jgi:hypothetical protein
MAAKEMYDYLDVASPDNDVTLSTPTPQGILTEEGELNQVVHAMDDGSDQVVTLATDKIFYVTLQWNALEPADAGTIMDYYFDAAKGNGIAESFKWDHPTDGHTYVVKFHGTWSRQQMPPDVQKYPRLRLKVIGRIAD